MKKTFDFNLGIPDDDEDEQGDNLDIDQDLTKQIDKIELKYQSAAKAKHKLQAYNSVVSDVAANPY